MLAGVFPLMDNRHGTAMIRRWLRRMAVLMLITPALQAAPLSQDAVPEPLRPWVSWALHGESESGCPSLHNRNARRCGWPSVLTLEVGAQSGRFQQSWDLYAHDPAWIPLPGDRDHWPTDVMVDGKRVVVVAREGRPMIDLPRGRHIVSGAFEWNALPKSIGLASDIGLLKLTRNGVAVANPAIRADGVLWLADEADEVSGDANAERADIRVYRRIIDDTPLQIVTHIDLDVSGRQREILIGPTLLENAIPLVLESPLAARLEADGRLRVQVRPGRWQLRVTARLPGQIDALVLTGVPAPWPEEEVWVFDARSDLRLVEVGGVPAIDARQTSLPGDWQSLPAYRLDAGERMLFDVVRRGDPDPNPDQLHLERTLWLDFDGGGYSLRDQIGGSVTRSWRLEAAPELQVGMVTLDGQPQVITRIGEGSGVGVEIRRGALNMTADSRYEGTITTLPAVGWQHDFQRVSATLQLPPGWRVFSASGVDNVPTTWLQRWTLLDIFLVLIATLTARKLWGWLWGALMFAMLVLTWHEPGAPAGVWLSLLAAVALLRVVPAGRLKQSVQWYGYLSLVVLIIISVPFLVWEVRTGIYPQLEQPGVRQQMHTVAPATEPADAIRSLDEAQVSGKIAPMEMEARPRKSFDSYSGPVYSQFSSQIDPDAVVQTGPGLPTWNWTAVPLSWNGPVNADQAISLVLISPFMNLLLNLMRVVLVALLVLRVVGRPIGRWSMPGGVLPLVLSLIGVGALLTLPARDVQAEELSMSAFPSDTLLKELKTRLLAPPECLPNCAQLSRMHLSIDEDRLTIRLQVEAHERTALPIPAQVGQWLPSSILVDGDPATGLFRTSAGELWIGVEAGVHEVIAAGTVPGRSALQLPLPLRPHRVSVSASGWSVTGVDSDGIPQGALQLTRLADHLATTALEPSSLPAFVRIERTVRLGTDWTVETRVQRVSPPGTSISLAIPLLAGESVVTDGMILKDGKVQIALAPNVNGMVWNSILEKRARFELKAAETTAWVEQWSLDISPIWHVVPSGIPVVHHQDPNANWFPTWRPWPGESVVLEVTRPQGVGGQTLTIEQSKLDVTPGKRATDVALSLELRSSQGGQHAITLPSSAELSSVTIDGLAQPIRLEEGRILLPIAPRAQNVTLQWREPAGMQNMFRTPEVDLGLPSVNANIHVGVSQDRWILFTGGPRLGPAVLFWGVLVVIVLIAIGLGRVTLTPLKTHHWILLGIGLSQSPIVPALIVVGWLFLLGLRGRMATDRLSGPLAFNGMQVLLVLFSLVALGSLFAAVEQGLLGRPDMQIAGNFSFANDLNWYQDRTDSRYPAAFVVSVPLGVYRLLMLAWALWLAFALLKWLRWGWECFSQGGLWRATPKAAPKNYAGKTEPTGGEGESP